MEESKDKSGADLKDQDNKENIVRFLQVLHSKLTEQCAKTRAEIDQANGNYDSIIELLEDWKTKAEHLVQENGETILGDEISLEEAIPQWNKNYKGDVDVYQNLHKMMSLMSEWKEFIKQQVALSPLITMDVAAMQKKELNVPDA